MVEECNHPLDLPVAYRLLIADPLLRCACHISRAPSTPTICWLELSPSGLGCLLSRWLCPAQLGVHGERVRRRRGRILRQREGCFDSVPHGRGGASLPTRVRLALLWVGMGKGGLAAETTSPERRGGGTSQQGKHRVGMIVGQICGHIR
eukprot:scaffold6405_cov390-Prasinococcus_capsulatus_cf.AAC.4